MIDPRALLIAGAIFIIMIAIAWIALQMGKPQKILKPINSKREHGGFER